MRYKDVSYYRPISIIVIIIIIIIINIVYIFFIISRRISRETPGQQIRAKRKYRPTAC